MPKFTGPKEMSGKTWSGPVKNFAVFGWTYREKYQNVSFGLVNRKLILPWLHKGVGFCTTISIISPLPAKPKGTLGFHSARPSVRPSVSPPVRQSVSQSVSPTCFPHFFLKRLDQMISYLVCGLILMSYRSSLSFVPLEWFLWKLWPLEIENFVKISVFRTFF